MNEVYNEIEQYIPHLRRYARAIAHNPVAADDLVQESLLRALAKSHLYKPGTNLRAWLFTILHNQHVSDMRRNGRTGISVDPDDAASALATQPNQEAGLIMNAVDRALQMLPDEQRILIELVALDGKSYEDVAKSYGLALGTVKSRISRGRSQMRKAVEGHDSCKVVASRPSREAKRAQPNWRDGRLGSRYLRRAANTGLQADSHAI